VKEGFTVREDYWGGDLLVKHAKAIVHQLFKGNRHWFWMGTDKDGAKISVHVYDSDGRLAEAESWQKPHKAAAMVSPKKTGSYYTCAENTQPGMRKAPRHLKEAATLRFHRRRRPHERELPVLDRRLSGLEMARQVVEQPGRLAVRGGGEALL
jgi:hypothetical protein